MEQKVLGRIRISQQDDQFQLDYDSQEQYSQISYYNNSNSSYILSQDEEDKKSINNNSQKCLKFFQRLNEQQECYEILKNLTDSFKLSYLKIEKEKLEQAPLKFLKKNNIQYLIRYWRQKNKREGNKDHPEIKKISHKYNKVKRQRRQKDPEYLLPASYKRQKTVETTLTDAERAAALNIIKDFDSFSSSQQTKILNGILTILKDDKEILFNAAQKQVNNNIRVACQLYQNHSQKEFLALLQSLSPMATILINIEISLTNNQLTEESNTLSETLLPFLNSQYDYNFIKEEHNFTMNRFLNSLIQHIQDNNTGVQQGFMLFVLHFDSQKAQNILQNEENKKALYQALLFKGFSQRTIQYFIQFSRKLLWPEVFNYLKGKEENSIFDNIQILSKLIIYNDPGIQLKKINNIYAQRRLLVDLLLQFDKIDITIENLIIILENLILLETHSIKKCFDNDPKQWLKISQIMINQENVLENSISQQQLELLYSEFTQNVNDTVTIQDISTISSQMCQECPLYQHNQYQCVITALLASQKENFIIATIPTGCGKTWIQALLAKYYCQQRQKITIVEPNEFLQLQTAEKIGQVDFRIRIATPEWLYQFMAKNDIIILNEYDEILTNQAYLLINKSLYGQWLLKDKKIIAFSATSNPAIEKYISNTIQEPKIIKFPSQCELVNGISNLQLGNIIPAKNIDQMYDIFKQDLKKYYEMRPVIIIIDNDQTIPILEHLKSERLKYLIGVSEQNIIEIRSWDYGVLVLRSFETRGVDTKFSKDAIVMIIARVENDIQYQQFIGRGSRSFGVSEGILYSPTNETSNQILQKLKIQNFTKYQQLEYLVKTMEKRNTNQNLIQAIISSEKKEKKLRSLNDLKEIIEEKVYYQLIKGISF